MDTKEKTAEKSPKEMKPIPDKSQLPVSEPVVDVEALDVELDLDPNAPFVAIVPPFAADPGHVIAVAEDDGNNQGNGTSHGACLCHHCVCCNYCRHGNSATIRSCNCSPRDANIPTECNCCPACKCLTVLKPEVIPDPPPQLQPIAV